jgi:DNA-binding NarL/FixJ family response regulator
MLWRSTEGALPAAAGGSMSELKTVNIILGEELPLIREALAELCRAALGCDVVAQCGDGATALDLILLHKPDVALLELGLPDLHTLEIVRRLRQDLANTRVLVMSVRRDRKTVLETLRSGAAGYILKSGSVEQLREAFRQIERGTVYVSPLLEMGKIFSTRKGPADDPIDQLSAREYQVFTLLVDGTRAKEIAARLELSPKTVDTYRASLMRKLDIHDVAGLVKFAIQRELAPAANGAY